MAYGGLGNLLFDAWQEPGDEGGRAAHGRVAAIGVPELGTTPAQVSGLPGQAQL